MIRSLFLRLVPSRAGGPATTETTGPGAGARPVAAHGSASAPGGASVREKLGAWSELLRVSALPGVPGDALAGAAASGARPGRGTAWAVGASLCLYEAGMALNDWADRYEDAAERPHRPLPSGRVSPGAALGAAGVLTAAGLALAARAGRPPLAVATVLAATVWAYDLRLKHTAAGPAAMAAARGLDLLLGATATVSTARRGTPGGLTGGAGGGSVGWAGSGPAGVTGNGPVGGAGGGLRRTTAPPPTAPLRTALPRTAPPPAVPVPTVFPLSALPAAAVLAAHTYAVTAVSRHEVHGGSTAAPLGALAASAVLGALTASPRPDPYRPGARRKPPAAPRRLPGRSGAERVTPLLAAVYFRTAARPLLDAALNPSPPLTRHAVGGGLRAMIPLQAALMSRSGAPVGGLALLGLVPLARRLARKVSPT
ncbi:SCO3242 family prenyltransferase [Streptomyces sp. NPDC056488]|uniref:SCO3242 family prenyltransferase n=1 Tax=Streptomyces sp. NPDC056488 TaxID=3345836 RepID=UPI003681A294